MIFLNFSDVSKKDKERTASIYSSSSSCYDQPSTSTSVKTSGSESEHEQEDKIRFNKLVKKAKYLAQDGQITKALELNKRALAIHYHEKLARRIAKMEVSLVFFISVCGEIIMMHCLVLLSSAMTCNEPYDY